MGRGRGIELVCLKIADGAYLFYASESIQTACIFVRPRFMDDLEFWLNEGI